jgi:hypothetical protein
MMDIIRVLDIRTYTSKEVMQLLMAYCDLWKFARLKVIYERYRHIWSTQQVVQNLMTTRMPGEAVLQYVDVCERAVKSTIFE